MSNEAISVLAEALVFEVALPMPWRAFSFASTEAHEGSGVDEEVPVPLLVGVVARCVVSVVVVVGVEPVCVPEEGGDDGVVAPEPEDVDPVPVLLDVPFPPDVPSVPGEAPATTRSWIRSSMVTI